MQLTLLQYVQSIANGLGSDEVNSISDSPESLQIAEIVRTAYYNVIARADLPEHKQLIQLEPNNNTATPVLMYIPDGVTKIDWLKYFNNNITVTSGTNAAFQHGLNVNIPVSSTTTTVPPPGYQDVIILPVHEFINITSGFNPSETNVKSMTLNDTSNNFPGAFTFYYKNDRQPMYCSVLSDWYVIFDSFDSTVDSTLQASKCLAYGEVIPQWQNVDSFIPRVDERQVPLLLNEAKSLAHFELKQSMHAKAEQESKRQWNAVQRDKSRVDKPSYFDQLPNFGKWGRSSYSGLSYFKARGWDRP